MNGRAEGGKQQKQKRQRSLHFLCSVTGQGVSTKFQLAAEMLPASSTVHAEGETSFRFTDAKCYLRTKYWFTITQHLRTTFAVCNTFSLVASL